MIDFVDSSKSRQVGTTHVVERGVVRLESSGREVMLPDGETTRALEYLFNKRPVPFADRLILRNIQETTQELKEDVDILV
jgi:hypothetical protein